MGHERQLPQRRSARLTHGRERNSLENKDKKPERGLPSPSTSNSPSSKLQQSASHSAPEDAEKSPGQPQTDQQQQQAHDDANGPASDLVRQLTEKQPSNSPGSPVSGGEARDETSALQTPTRKRKRSPGAESSTAALSPINDRASVPLEGGASESKERFNITPDKLHPVDHWIQQGQWPEAYFQSEPIRPTMSVPSARERRSAALRQETVESSSLTPSQTTAGKSAPYRSLDYEDFLGSKGSFLYDFSQGITDKGKQQCSYLLAAEQAVPSDSLFRHDIFHQVCDKLRGRNAARVVSDIARLVAPSPETLATFGDASLTHLISGLNERWNHSIPVTAVHPQPDFSVGFALWAFSKEHFPKLELLTGDLFVVKKPSSFFLATRRMYFPFFTCESKSGTGGLDIADRQNAHSMTVAVRAVVELFRLVNRQNELHRKILAFSISHDDKIVTIFGHYPVISAEGTTYYRHLIQEHGFRYENGKDRWTSYKFTKNIYHHWMPDHLRLICSALADIPANLNFEVSVGAEDEWELPEASEMATSTRPSDDTVTFKKPRLTVNAMLREEIRQSREEIERQIQESERQRQDSERQRQDKEHDMKQDMDRLLAQNRDLMNLLQQR